MYLRIFRAKSATEVKIEDSAADHVALDLSEPQLHLVQPRGIGGSEVETNFGMLRQEFLYGFGLVGRKIVRQDVDFIRPPRLAEQLIQKGDELGAGVPLGRFTFYFAGLHIQSRI